MYLLLVPRGGSSTNQLEPSVKSFHHLISLNPAYTDRRADTEVKAIGHRLYISIEYSYSSSCLQLLEHPTLATVSRS